MDSKKEYYVNEDELKEDVRILYETGEFPDRLTKGLVRLVDGVLHHPRFWGYTKDWKEEMRSNAIAALFTSLSQRRYDNTRPNTRVFSWATKVVFNQFYYFLEKKKREIKHTKELLEMQQ